MLSFTLSAINASSLSLAISYPSIAAAPHMFVNSYKNILAVAVATEYSFPEADKVKEYLKVLSLMVTYKIVKIQLKLC